MLRIYTVPRLCVGHLTLLERSGVSGLRKPRRALAVSQPCMAT